MTVLLDGKRVDSSAAGVDVEHSKVAVTTDRLYNLVDLRGNASEHVLLLRYAAPGIEAFASTFG